MWALFLKLKQLVELSAVKDIKKNEELTYDYGFSFDKDYKDFPCRCGTKKCVGYIVNSQSRWRVIKAKKKKSTNK